MAFKFAVLAALCIAQGFAFQPLNLLRGNDECKNPALTIPYEFDQSIQEVGEVGETVSLAAMEAYAAGNDFLVVIACFEEQRPNYIKLGQRISEKVNAASRELAQKIGEKTDKYEKLIQGPARKIAVTFRETPLKVYDLLREKEFLKASQVLKEARETVRENARIIGQHLRDLAGEVPELADRTEELAREIYEESRAGADAIQQAFNKCVQEGGPKKPASDQE